MELLPLFLFHTVHLIACPGKTSIHKFQNNLLCMYSRKDIVLDTIATIQFQIKKTNITM